MFGKLYNAFSGHGQMERHSMGDFIDLVLTETSKSMVYSAHFASLTCGPARLLDLLLITSCP